MTLAGPKCTHDLKHLTADEKVHRATSGKIQKQLAEVLKCFSPIRAAMGGQTKQIEDRVMNIVRPLCPDGIWPGSQDPMTSVNQALVMGYHFEHKYEDNFRIRVREHFARYCVAEPIGSLGALIVFESDLRKIISGRKSKTPGAWESLSMSTSNLVILDLGVLFALEHRAEQLLSPGVPLIKGLKAKRAFHSTHIKGCPDVETKKFSMLFTRVQNDFLKWAGISEDKAIVLPS